MNLKRIFSFFAIFVFLLSVFFISCDDDDDLSDDLEENFSTSYTFSPYKDDYGQSDSLTLKYKIGETLVAKDLPNVNFPQFFAINPGHKIEGWKFYKNPITKSEERPQNIYVDENKNDIVSLIEVTSAPAIFCVSEWIPITYYIVFDANGGSGTMAKQAFEYDEYESQNLNENEFTREDYIFDGWRMGSAENASSTYSDGQAVRRNLSNVDGDEIILYAVWYKNEITINFDSNADDGVGGTVSGTMNAQIINLAKLPQNLHANKFSREGHDFIGWNDSRDGTGTAYSDGEKITKENYPENETTLYAQWSIKNVTLNFESNGGTAVESQGVVWNQKASAPESPSKAGYDFAGWFTSDDGGKTLSSSAFDFATSTIKADTTLYAKWEAQSLTIKFNENSTDASGSMPEQKFTVDELPQNLQANQFTRKNSNYEFAGWASSASATEAEYSDGEEISLSNWEQIRTSENITLYAVWELKSVTVNFMDLTDSENPSIFATTSVKLNEKVARVTETTKEHYTFDDWYSDSSFTSKFDFSQAIKAETEIYGKWIPETYTVSFDANGGSGTMEAQEFTYGLTQTLSKCTFSKSGYNFGGWATSSSSHVANYGDEAAFSAESDLTLYAIWTQRGSISVTNNLIAELDEENEQIIFKASGSYVSYTWTVTKSGGTATFTTSSISLPYSEYADGKNHFVYLIGVDANGEGNTESANFKILPTKN